MNELFIREATLAVGPTQAGGIPLASAVSGKQFKGFRITFEIDKTSESAPNPAKISIYNLSAASRAALEDQGLACLLSAGYSGIGQGAPLVSQIFSGDVRRTITSRQGPDLITTIEAGDAELALRNTHIEQAFGDFTTPAAVIKTLASKLGVAVGTVVPAVANFFQHGVSLSGLVSDQLDTLCAKAGLEWHVTDGELNILTPGLPTAEPAVLVSKATGLIGFPSKRINGFVDFKSLLNPQLKPGRAVSLVSSTITGVFKARTCRYRGDTKGGEFSVAVEAF